MRTSYVVEIYQIIGQALRAWKPVSLFQNVAHNKRMSEKESRMYTNVLDYNYFQKILLVKYATINIIYQSWFIFNISFINEISTVMHTKLLEEMWIFPKGAETLNIILLLVTDGVWQSNQIH